jgi:Acyl-CoA reductase (LuxC).
VAQLLDAELRNQQRKNPRSVLRDAEYVAIQRARTDAEMRALMGGKAAVFASGHSTAWSALDRELDGSGADEDLASRRSPLNRTVNLVAVPEWLDAARRLTSRRGRLQSYGVAVDSTRLFGLADTLAEVGVNRICPLGEMDRAKSGRHHDGGFNLIDLSRAVDVERGSDAYSDSFDMDME